MNDVPPSVRGGERGGPGQPIRRPAPALLGPAPGPARSAVTTAGPRLEGTRAAGGGLSWSTSSGAEPRSRISRRAGSYRMPTSAGATPTLW
jgi:hypothetical protein